MKMWLPLLWFTKYCQEIQALLFSPKKPTSLGLTDVGTISHLQSFKSRWGVLFTLPKHTDDKILLIFLACSYELPAVLYFATFPTKEITFLLPS